MVCHHLRDSKKGSAATTLPESTQEKQPRVQTDGGLLPHHYRKCTNLLHLGVVLRLHCGRQESPPKGHQLSSNKSLPAPATSAQPITSLKTSLTQATTCLLSCPRPITSLKTSLTQPTTLHMCINKAVLIEVL